MAEQTEDIAAARGHPARPLLVLVPVLLFAGLVAAFWIGLGHDPQALPSALVGKPVPDFDLPPIEVGKRGLRKADLGGRPALINFFASWCAPCRVEQPTLIALAAQHGIALYGIDYKDRPEDAQAYLQSLGDPYAGLGMDRDGRTGIDFGIYGVPETFIVDAGGTVRFRYAGPITEDVLTNEILPRIAALMKGG